MIYHDHTWPRLIIIHHDLSWSYPLRGKAWFIMILHDHDLSYYITIYHDLTHWEGKHDLSWSYLWLIIIYHDLSCSHPLGGKTWFIMILPMINHNISWFIMVSPIERENMIYHDFTWLWLIIIYHDLSWSHPLRGKTWLIMIFFWPFLIIICVPTQTK